MEKIQTLHPYPVPTCSRHYIYG